MPMKQSLPTWLKAVRERVGSIKAENKPVHGLGAAMPQGDCDFLLSLAELAVKAEAFAKNGGVHRDPEYQVGHAGGYCAACAWLKAFQSLQLPEVR